MTPTPPAAARAFCAALVLVLAGCASAPSEMVERVDEKTAVTVVTLPSPLVFSGPRGGVGQPLDLTLGPVEVNRQGARSYFLWAALLGDDLSRGEPRLRLTAGGETLVELAPEPVGTTLPVSRAPYRRPAEWASERWYAIRAAELARVYGRSGVAVEIGMADGQWIPFTPWDERVAGLDAFVAAQLHGQVAAR